MQSRLFAKEVIKMVTLAFAGPGLAFAGLAGKPGRMRSRRQPTAQEDGRKFRPNS